MGIQGTNIADVTGASVLVIEQACENTQLLVSLCRNGNQWLSPVGWTEKQKITLLDCRSQGGKTEVDIPAEFSKTLVSGDKLLLTCSELDLTQEITWEASSLLTRPVADITPSSAGLAGGLLSRFKSNKVSEIEDTKSEAQLLADEADIAAESYRAKMETATAAREQAQRRALEAAKEAEAALKMEAERISDMERAAKAFEEAERLKRDGLRRVEEERRQEEARIAEETRRIDEARRREEAAKFEIERKAALERYEAALDVTQNEEARLQNRLSRLKTDAGAFETQQSETSTALSALNTDMDTVQNKVDTSRSAFEKTASKLDSLNTELTGLQSKSDNASTESSDVTARVAAVEAEYLTAQREAEMAIARAEEKRNLLDAARKEKDAVLSQLDTLSKTLTAHTELVSETTLKTQNLQSKFEAAQAAFNDKAVEIDTLENEQHKITDSIQTSRLEIEATQQAIEDCGVRQTAHQKAIIHLETGGNPAEVPEFDLETRFFAKNEDDYVAPDSDGSLLNDQKTPGLLGRVRRSFSRSKDAEISVELDDVHLDDDLHKRIVLDDIQAEAITVDDADGTEKAVLQFTVEDIIVERELKTAGFVNRHSKKLLAVGTILGGAAILGGGYIATQVNQSEGLSVKSSYPATTQYASSAGEIKIPALETPALTTTILSPAVEVPVIMEKLPAIEIQTKTPAASVELEIPDVSLANLTLTGLSLENIPAKVLAVKKAPVKKISTKVTNYPVLTNRVQRQLQTLGFYSGPLSGQKTQETTEAIKTFQELYGLPQHGRISGKFLTALLNAEAQKNSAKKYAALTNVVPQEVTFQPEGTQTSDSPVQNIQFAETPFSAPVFYDTVTPASTTNVVTNGLPAADVSNVPAESYYGSQPSGIEYGLQVVIPTVSPALATQQNLDVVKEATAPRVNMPAPAPAVQDVIVEAQRTRAARASYPNSAAAKNYFVDVRIVVGYDIDPSGKVANARVLTNDHTGRFNSSFERAAVKAVKQQKFNAKTVNGQAVSSTGQTQRIVFKGQ